MAPKRFRAPQNRPSGAGTEIAALTKTMFLDMELAILVYVEACETAKLAAEARAKETSQAVMKLVGEALVALAAGDLTHRIGNDVPGEYATLKNDFNNAVSRLAGTLSTIQATANVINNNIDEIAFALDDLSRRTEQQAANLVQTTPPRRISPSRPPAAPPAIRAAW